VIQHFGFLERFCQIGDFAVFIACFFPELLCGSLAHLRSGAAPADLLQFLQHFKFAVWPLLCLLVRFMYGRLFNFEYIIVQHHGSIFSDIIDMAEADATFPAAGLLGLLCLFAGDSVQFPIGLGFIDTNSPALIIGLALARRLIAIDSEILIDSISLENPPTPTLALV
jgi:hypothetical protein